MSVRIWERIIFVHLPLGIREEEGMENGPWMFGKDLVVLAEFDEVKRIDEIAFTSIPI